ncbi:ABC transporter substrate-binding protein [Nocardioides sp. NBC_00850]|uniref:ABC transporter substrate-binding protein n=1 Tax=Nocardioides sp. NBC_00850 TaxID=2976001 RepID=UPI003862DA6D|nr:ABC transporter substrate-binding protein [Nocardioides sp. NBC_00850]
MRKPTKLVALLSAAVLSAAALAGCGGSSEGDGAPKDTLTLATPTPLTTFDPTQMDCGSGRLYCQAAYDTLLHPAPDGTPEPGMATSFTYDDTRTELTLELRSGITFSDGTAFDATVAKAVIDWFGRTDGPRSTVADAIKSVSAPGPDRLVIKLKEPDPALLVNLTDNLGIMTSPAALKSGNLTKVPVTSGPYLYSADKSQTGTTVFERNEDYWDAEAYPFDHLKLVQLADPNTLLNALKVGQIDAAAVLSQQLKPVKEAGFTVRESAGAWYGLILADRAGDVLAPLGDVRVRQAINLAVDRKLFTEELLPGGSTLSAQIFAPGGAVYDDELNQQYERDLAKAKDLMAAAGFASGFTATMPDLSQFVGSPALNTAITQQLGEIGIKVVWQKVPVTELLSSMQDGKFPMFFMSLGTKAPWQDIQLSVLPTATFNPYESEDPALAKLLAVAKKAAPGAPQDQAFRAINTWLVENAWFAPMFASSTNWVSVDGITVEPQTQGIDLVRFQRSEK